MSWVSRNAFKIYKTALAFLIYQGFKNQEVYPLEVPVDEQIELVPYPAQKPVANIPKLYAAKNYPEADRAKPRLRKIKSGQIVMKLLGLLPMRGLPPIPAEHDAFIKAVYPPLYRKARPHPPEMPPELQHTGDRLATLALTGPFADYIKRITANEIETINAIQVHHVDADAYTIDLEELGHYPVKRGLCPIGCTVIFKFNTTTQQLETQSILYRGTLYCQKDDEWKRVEQIALCSLNTHVTIIKHNVYIHLAYLTVFTSTTINKLKPTHPIRRLLHHCFQTVLIGNYEVSQFQIRGKSSYCTKLFSYDYNAMIDMVNAYCDRFDIRMMDPILDTEMRQMDHTPFEYPYLDQIKPLWHIIEHYVSEYVDHYYPSDQAVQNDDELSQWYDTLDQLMPGGVKVYGEALNTDILKRLCASLIHTSTATHDNVNNVVWNYTALNYAIPTMVREDGQLPPVNISFDFLATLIGTFKPFNMLLDGMSLLALDMEGRRMMDRFVENLKARQAEMDKAPFQYHGIYPKHLNYSISN